MKRRLSKKLFRSLVWAAGYTTLIFSSLYFTPYLRDYLAERYLLARSVSAVYLLSSWLTVALLLYKYRVSHPLAYLWFAILFALFIFEFLSVELLIERIHLIEYALLFAIWFRVFRHLFCRVTIYGATLWFVCLIGLLDEGVQNLLPNRVFAWSDVNLNTLGAIFGMGAVTILMHFRRDKSKAELTFSWKPS